MVIIRADVRISPKILIKRGLSIMQERYFASYTLGDDAFSKFNEVCKGLGRNYLLIGGKTALSVSRERLISSISSYFNMVDEVIYGTECLEERVFELSNIYKDKNIDFVVGVGGGKAIDTSKYLADVLNVPVVTVPTIASTCAASSALSVIYTKEHSFSKFVYYTKPAYHCFIDTKIIREAPYKFIRAGIGDTLAKHYEVEFSARGRVLDYSSELAVTISSMCNEPLMRYAKKALEDVVDNKISYELEQIILAIIITTGMVSMMINPDYNGAMAHALFYGLTEIEGFEEKFLHGDVVGYCTAVQLAVDGNINEAKRIVEFLKSIRVETSLKERNIPCDREYLDEILKSALKDPDMKVIPYEVTEDMLFEGIKLIEELS